MATESVKILIEAEDQASAKIAAASKEVENRIKNIKDVGGKAKASTEFIGTLAGALGGSELASYASQLGGLTEKVSAFSEVQKTGGAGAFAFKAGLAGVAGVLAFQVGNAIGNAIFQTDKWAEALKTAAEEAKRLESAASQLRTERFQDTRADIELIRDPDQKQAEYKKLLDDLKKNIVGVEVQVQTSKKAVEEWDEAWQITGDRKGFAEQAKAQLESDKERLKLLQDQQKEIQRLIGIEAEREELRKRNAALDSDQKYLESLDKQLSMLQAIKEDSQIDFGNVSNIERLQKEIQLLEQQKDGIAALREQVKQSTSGIVVEEVAATLSEEDKKQKAKVEKELQFANQRIAELTEKRALATSQADVSSISEGIALYEKERDALQQINQQLAARATGAVVGMDAAKEAEAKLVAIKLIEKQTELERLQREEKKAALKEIADLEFNSVMAAEKAFMAERDRLAEQKVLLDQGAEAAHAFRLAKQGIAEEDAKSFAAQQSELDKQKQVQEKMKQRETAQPLQAVSSRFLTRGPIDDKMLDVAKSQLKVQQEQLAELKKPKPEGPKMRDVRLVEVG